MASDEIIDRLYGLPLAEFTQARNDAASELRKAGEREAADQVKALRKPTATAAAVNRLVREHRDEVEQFLHAAVALRDAQFGGGDLAAATKRERDELEKLTGVGGEAVRQTLLAAAADEDAARQLLEARLERELEPSGFGTLLAHVPEVAAKPAGAAVQTQQAAPKKKQDDSAARAALKDAKAALRAAEAEERGAHGAWEQSQQALKKAQAAFEKAQAELDRLHETS